MGLHRHEALPKGHCDLRRASEGPLNESHIEVIEALTADDQSAVVKQATDAAFDSIATREKSGLSPILCRRSLPIRAMLADQFDLLNPQTLSQGVAVRSAVIKQPVALSTQPGPVFYALATDSLIVINHQ